MLSPTLLNRVDKIFADKKSKSRELINDSSLLSHHIHAYLERCGYSVSYDDVEARLSFLITHTDTSYISRIQSKGGRPTEWHLQTKHIRLPQKYHAALKEIALEWQENEFGEAPF
ncbi:hypothetical protein A6769_39470 [Nostoc punctiforme NIES-2108]|uniref:Uncharacterized protein n=1 Tax=Nostoc punctiforme NIES-2108 TaxID=1356359 RepID=A0A367RYN3_NOSPU|nr:hypothetical protein A6769_39470 [Nostoc punctiforme NIES-2108]